MQTLTRSFKTIQKIFDPITVVNIPGTSTRVRAPIGHGELPSLDPFVALYYFDIKSPFGFPDHPHLGMETMTFIIDGEYKYEDFHGHEGTMEPGHLQWMTAGKGLVHAERPSSGEKPAVGLQWWMNLPLKEKFCDPEYQEITPDRVPVAEKDGVKVKVLAGESLGVKSPVRQRHPVLMLEINMPANAKFEQDIPKGWNAFTIVHEGKAYFGEKGEEAKTHETVLLNKDDNEVLLIETKEEGAKIYLTASLPIGEPVHRFDAVILASEEEKNRAVTDWKEGKEGFARDPKYQSDIDKYLADARKPKPQAQ